MDTRLIELRVRHYKGPMRQGAPIMPNNDYAVKVVEKPSGKVVVDVLDKSTSYKLKYPNRAKFEEDWA